MGVKMKIAGIIRQATNWQEVVDVKGATILECLNDLEARYPETRKWIYNRRGEILDRFQVCVNGEQIQTSELSNPVSEGDELLIMLNICGG